MVGLEIPLLDMRARIGLTLIALYVALSRAMIELGRHGTCAKLDSEAGKMQFRMQPFLSKSVRCVLYTVWALFFFLLLKSGQDSHYARSNID